MRENSRKHQLTLCFVTGKQRKTICFQGVNHAVNTSKTACFPAFHRGGKLSDNGTKTRVHRQENKRKTLDFTIGKRKRMYAKCRIFAMLTDSFLSGWTLLFLPWYILAATNSTSHQFLPECWHRISSFGAVTPHSGRILESSKRLSWSYR